MQFGPPDLHEFELHRSLEPEQLGTLGAIPVSPVTHIQVTAAQIIYVYFVKKEEANFAYQITENIFRVTFRFPPNTLKNSVIFLKDYTLENVF